MVEGDLKPAHPIAVTLATSLEAIDTLPGAKWSSPGIMPDETKLALADCASCSPMSPVTFEAVRHCSLPWSALLSLACRFRGSPPASQLSAGRRRASKWGMKPIRRLTTFGRSPMVANHDPGAPFISLSPDQRSWRPSFTSIVEISQSLRSTSIASVAFLTQINQFYSALRHCRSPTRRVQRMATGI
jgi:hypothetical protein